MDHSTGNHYAATDAEPTKDVLDVLMETEDYLNDDGGAARQNTKESFGLDCAEDRSDGDAMKTKKKFKFTSLGSAQIFVDGCTKMHGIILGDDDRFWVVCMADFDQLLKAGYEAA